MTNKPDNKIEKLVEKNFPDSTTNQKKKLANKIESIPISFRKRYITAMKGKNKLVAMEYFCLECMGFTHDECDCFTCPLYPYRKSI